MCFEIMTLMKQLRQEGRSIMQDVKALNLIKMTFIFGEG